MTEIALPPKIPAKMELPRLRPWQVLTVLALMVMELNWVVPWYRVLTRNDVQMASLAIFVVLGSILLASYLMISITNYLHLKRRIFQLLLLAFLFISVFLALNTLLDTPETLKLGNRLAQAFAEPSLKLPIEFVIILAVLLAWWRGIVLAREQLGPHSVVRHFRFGVIMFLANGALTYKISEEMPYLELFVFMFAGLVAMGGARLSSLGKLRGGRGSPFDRRWLMGVGTVAAGLIVLAAIVAFLARGPLATFVAQVTSFVWDLVARLLVVFLSPLIFFLGELLWRLAVWFFSSTEPSSDKVEIQPGSLDELMERIRQTEQASWAPDLLTYVKSFLLWGIIILVVIFLLKNLWSRIRNVREDKEGEREWLAVPGGLFKLLRTALQRRVQRILEGIESLRYPQKHLAAARIRRVYARLMSLSSDLGSPRPPQCTPLEFLPNLGRLFPLLDDDLITITRAYVRVRYGELPETRQEVELVEAAWNRVLECGEEKMKGELI